MAELAIYQIKYKLIHLICLFYIEENFAKMTLVPLGTATLGTLSYKARNCKYMYMINESISLANIKKVMDLLSHHFSSYLFIYLEFMRYAI